MSVLEFGPTDAPPLILLHGWGASKEIWTLTVRPPLSESYRLIALDLPGTGDVPPLENSTGSSLADWVAEEASRLGINRFSVLGHSMGGNVAAHLAQRHSERIQAVVLVSAALHSHRLTAANWYLHPVAGPVTLGGARTLAGLAGWIEARLRPVDYPGWGRGYMRRSGYMMFNNTLPGLRTQLQGLLDGPVEIRELPEQLPALILHGGKDGTIPVAWAREAAETRLENTELIVYDDALHCPMDTHTQRFVEDVTRFLDRALGAAS